MRASLNISLPLIAFLSLEACGPMGENPPRQELIDSLRMLGMQAEKPVYEIPATAISNTSATFTVLAASNKDTDVTLDAWTPDNPPGNALLVSEAGVGIDTKIMHKEQKGSLFLFTGSLKVDIPQAEAWKRFPATGGRVAFGLKMSAGDATEYAMGEILAYPSGAQELAWKPPTLELTSPIPDTKVSKGDKVDLALTTTSPQNEALLLGWFVSSGQIAGRRMKETSWTPDDKGTQTLIATVRGRDSLAFAWQVITVEVE